MTVPIDAVMVDALTGLTVRPRLTGGADYAHIHRDASGVAWFPEQRALGGREPHRWAPVDLYRQIVAAVRNEYGKCLVLSHDTAWLNVPSSLRAEIEALPSVAPPEVVALATGWREAHEASLVEEAVGRARAALRDGHFAAAVGFLSPHEGRLSPAAVALLALCRSRSGQ